MKSKVFIATTGEGIARAARVDGNWLVDHLLADQDVRCLAADPLNPEVVYAGTQGNGVLRSEDRGQTWQPAGLKGEKVKSLAISPHRPGLIYAGVSPAAVHVTHNGGQSWSELTGFQRVRSWWWFSPAEQPMKPYVQAITLSPTEPDVVLAGIELGAVVRSEDGGQTWSGHRQGALRDCHTMTFHASNGDWAYEAGGSGGGASFSRNGGRSWEQHKAGLDCRYGWACAADPERPEVWYVSAGPQPSLLSFKFIPQAHIDGQAGAHIYRSAGGAAWEKLGGGLPQPLDYMAYGLLTDPDAPGHLYAGLSNGQVWHSADYGDNWALMPFNLGSVRREMVLI
jgi:photosystem II stability/assembly factor-like uncharacterized protein